MDYREYKLNFFSNFISIFSAQIRSYGIPTLPEAKSSVHPTQQNIAHLAFLKLMSDFAPKIEITKIRR